MFDWDKVKWFRTKIKAWAKDNLRDFPWRRTQDPYAILVAEFLLQQTSARSMFPIYQEFIQRYPTVVALTEAPVSEVGEILRPLGLKFRAAQMHQAASTIADEYKGKIPESKDLLLRLPGVGEYTARSVLANAFNRPLAVLDTNIARIIERFFGLVGGRVKSRDRSLWEAAQKIAPKTRVGVWNLALIDFGAAVCTARKPHCSECPLQKQCHYFATVSKGLL